MLVSTTPIIATVAMIAMVLLMITVSLIARHKVNKGDNRMGSSGSRIVLGELGSYERCKEHEQEEFARRVDLRNKTFDLYEQVRRNAESEDTEPAKAERSMESEVMKAESLAGHDSDKTSANPSVSKT